MVGVCGVAGLKSVEQHKGGSAAKRLPDVAANRALLSVLTAKPVVDVEVSCALGGAMAGVPWTLV